MPVTGGVMSGGDMSGGIMSGGTATVWINWISFGSLFIRWSRL